MQRNGLRMQLQSKDTLDSTVYIRIKEMIVHQELKPGSLIVQNQLSQSLGVSRTPLRKALAQLEKEGLLEGSPRGWYVKEFTRNDLISVFRIRAVLEGLACRLAAEKIGSPELAYMRTMFEQAYRSIGENQAEDYYQADLKFHAMITDIAGDPLLKRTIESNQIIFASQMRGLYRDPHETFDEHMAILDELGKRNGKEAERLMQEHIDKAAELLSSNDYRIYR